MIERLSFSIAVDLTGMLGLFFMLFSFREKNAQISLKTRHMFIMFILLILVLASDMHACLFRGKTDFLIVLHVANMATFVFSVMLLMTFFSYLHLDLQLRTDKWPISSILVSFLGLLTIIGTLLNPIHNKLFLIPSDTALYEQGPLFFLIPGYCGFALGICILIILLQKGIPVQKRVSLLLCCLFPLIGNVFQQLFTEMTFDNMSALFSALTIYASNYFEQNQEFAAKELELENTRSALVLSQIQPHFLFNSMAVVMDLCSTNPTEAQAALQELSDYLHYKISALSHSYVVSFSEDMEFLQNYVKLEKRRFGARLNVEYDIQYTDFQIPLLTLQPLVENAIRHGISKKPNGGTICIRTAAQQEYITILIEDDGVGFHAQKQPELVGEHVGINSVRNRLAALCHGTLTIRSTPGAGTTVEITLCKTNSGGEA